MMTLNPLLLCFCKSHKYKNWLAEFPFHRNLFYLQKIKAQFKTIYSLPWFYKKIFFTMFSFNNTQQTKSLLKVSIMSKEIWIDTWASSSSSWVRTETCLVHSGKVMCGKMTCKVKPLISLDHFSADIIYYLV